MTTLHSKRMIEIVRCEFPASGLKRKIRGRLYLLGILSLFASALTIEACSFSGSNDDNRNQSPTEKAYAECSRNNASGCDDLAIFVIRASEGSEIKSEVSLLQQKCSESESSGCNGLGTLFMTGIGIEHDELSGRNLFMIACDNGNGEACFNASGHWLNAETLPTSSLNALKLGTKACRKGQLGGCAIAAEVVFYHWFFGGTIKLLNTSLCQLGSADACFEAGVLHRGRKYKDANDQKSRRYYEKSCSMNHLGGCVNLGSMLMKGEGGEKDLPRARELFKHSCDQNVTLGCFNFAIMLNRGYGGKPDTTAATILFKKLCADGYALACKLQDFPSSGQVSN